MSLLSEPHLIEHLVHPDGRLFERGLATLTHLHTESGEDSIRLFTTLCATLSGAEKLGPVEQDRRTTLILRRAPNSPEFLRSLAIAATDWSAHVRGAVARFLPPVFKQLVYARPSGDVSAKSVIGTAASPPAQDTPLAIASRVTDTDKVPEVLLLGTAQEQDPNRRRLESEHFRPCRASSLVEFMNLLTPDVSGIVVGRSWWALLPSEEHQSFIDKLFGYSSFTWTKVDDRGCACADKLYAACRAARYRDPTAKELSLGDVSSINDMDLHALRNASALIDNAAGLRLCPADINPSQAQVLIGGIAEQVSSRHLPATVHLEQIATTPMQGGQSQSLIIRAQPDDGGLPFIAKLADITLLRGEMDRFCRYIAPWDSHLRPQLYFHDGIAAIIFGLVASPDDPADPAPTLEDVLESALLTETGAPTDGVPTEVDMMTLVDRTVRKISSLNQRPCADCSVSSLAWIDVRSVDAILERGIQWQLPLLPDGRRPLDLRCRAVELLEQMHHVATIHGDLHIRNVLVRDREPFLIDYSYAGPGHPCFDLVRFESGLMYQAFRVTDDERSIQELVLAVANESATLQNIRQRFPTLCTSLGNRVAIQAAISARDECSRLLAEYDGGFEQYIAMKLVVACQSLCIQRLQGAVVRATISAVAQLLAEHI